jgi:hypothetical protein
VRRRWLHFHIFLSISSTRAMTTLDRAHSALD